MKRRNSFCSENEQNGFDNLQKCRHEKTITFSMAEAEIQPVRESHWHDFILWENAP
jgi:hypothetical protein